MSLNRILFRHSAVLRSLTLASFRSFCLLLRTRERAGEVSGFVFISREEDWQHTRHTMLQQHTGLKIAEVSSEPVSGCGDGGGSRSPSSSSFPRSHGRDAREGGTRSRDQA